MPPRLVINPYRICLDLQVQYHNPRASRAASRRAFATTPLLLDDPKPTHYEVLNLNPSATPAEIKKQFYVLSKSSHPDRNPSDPNASARFASINESYQVLSHSDRRSRYDREILPAQHRPQSSSGSGTHRGSYAGSRPASGLSKRRGTFRGPPPSFYAHGGASRSRQAPNHNDSAWKPSSTAPGGGLGPGGATSASENDVPHFDRQAVYSTQSMEDTRRGSRAAMAAAEAARHSAEIDRDFWMRFLIVGGALFGTIGLASAWQRVQDKHSESRWGTRKDRRVP